MNVTGNIDFLNRAISNQRAAARFQLLLAGGVFGLGLAWVVMSHILPHLLPGSEILDDLRWPQTLGGAFVSTLPGFRLKDIFSTKDKVAALTFLLQEFQRLQKSTTPADLEQLNRLEHRFWQFVDKNLTG